MSLVVFSFDLNCGHGGERFEGGPVIGILLKEFPLEQIFPGSDKSFPSVPAERIYQLLICFICTDFLLGGFWLCQTITTVPPVAAILLEDPRTSKNSSQRIIVAGGDRVEEVVVAARAGKVKTKKSLRRG